MDEKGQPTPGDSGILVGSVRKAMGCILASLTIMHHRARRSVAHSAIEGLYANTKKLRAVVNELV